MKSVLIFFFVMGIVIGVIVRLIIKNIRKAVELNYWERDMAIEKVGVWLAVYAWIIILVGMVFSAGLVEQSNKDMRVLDRIEAVECLVNLLTADTLHIKDVLKDE